MAVSKKKVFGYIVLGLFSLLVILAGAIYIQLSHLDQLKEMAVEQLQGITGRKVSVGHAELDYSRGVSIRLQEVSIDDQTGERKEFTARSVWTVIKLLPLLDQRIEIKKVIVEGASFELIRDKEGELNVEQVQDWLNSPSDGGGMFSLLKVSAMNRLILTDGVVRFVDYHASSEAEPPPILVQNIHFTIRKKFLKKHFRFSLSGEIPNPVRSTQFNLSGTFDNPAKRKDLSDLSVDGEINIEELPIARFRPYLKKAIFAPTDNAWLSLNSKFSGTLNGRFRSNGKIRFSPRPQQSGAVIRDRSAPKRGTVDYKITVDEKNLQVEELRMQSGNFNSRVRGVVSDFRSANTKIRFRLSTDPFLVDKSQRYLPLKILPYKFHNHLQNHFHHGTIEIIALQFDGSLNQLKNIDQLGAKSLSLFSANMVLRNVDWLEPLPPLKRVTGNFNSNGDNLRVKILKAQYEDFPISDVQGTIKRISQAPYADFTLENRVDMGKFHLKLLEEFADTAIASIVDVYKDMQGVGVVGVHIKGPLNNPDQMSLSGTIGMEEVSLFQEGLEPRVENLNGLIYYSYPFGFVQEDPSWAPIVRYQGLHGTFGNSAFSKLNGDFGFLNEESWKKQSGTYVLNALDLPSLISSMDFEGPLRAIHPGVDYMEGDVIVDYRAVGNPDRAGSVKEWGNIGLKDMSVKYGDSFRPVSGLIGNIRFENGKIQLQNLTGWYGDSPVRLSGDVVRPFETNPQFTLRLASTDFVQPDLKDLPFLESLDLDGPAQFVLKLSGNPGAFDFENHVDLTRASYSWKDSFVKPRAVSNKLIIKGHADEKGIRISGLGYDLMGNMITGKGRIKSFDEPTFTLYLDSKNFKIQPVKGFLRDLKSSESGTLHFQFQGQGDFNRFEDAHFEGTIQVDRLVLQPEHYARPITVSSHVNFSDNKFQFTDGSLETGQTKTNFKGAVQWEETPIFNLAFKGERVNLNELLPDDGSESSGFTAFLKTSDLFKGGSKRISVDFGRFEYKSLTFDQVSGSVILGDKTLKIDGLKIGRAHPIHGQAVLSLKDSDVLHFEGQAHTKNNRAEEFFSLFGDAFQSGLTGKMNHMEIKVAGSGRNWAEISRSLNGKVAFDLKSGRVDTKKLKLGIIKLTGSEPPKKEKNPDPLNKPTETFYEQISGDFDVKNGIAKTENFISDTEQRRTSVVGQFDLTQNKMDTVVGVAPLAELDKLLTKIPIFGKIITAGDEKSLVKTYYKVKGDFSDPEITPILFTSLSKKIGGIFQGILQTPKEILSPLEASKIPPVPAPAQENIP